jgi:prevent-host-death family protein
MINATDAKARMGELLEDAQKEPVTIARNGRPIVVVVSASRFEELEAMEDAYWAQRAQEAARSGFLGTEETRKFIEGTLSGDTKSVA